MFKRTPQIIADAQNNALSFLNAVMIDRTKEQLFDLTCMTLEMSAYLAASCIFNLVENKCVAEDKVDTAIDDFRNLVVYYHNGFIQKKEGEIPDFKKDFLH